MVEDTGTDAAYNYHTD